MLIELLWGWGVCRTAMPLDQDGIENVLINYYAGPHQILIQYSAGHVADACTLM